MSRTASIALPGIRWSLREKFLRRFRLWKFQILNLGSFAHLGAGSIILPGASIIGKDSICIGDGVEIGGYARLEARVSKSHGVAISIGNGVKIQPFIHIGAASNVSIGKGALIASGVYITDHDHDYSNPEDPVVSNKKLYVAPVVIEDFAWIGERAMILKGVRVGSHSIIGAGSIVTKDVPPFCVAVGSPAKVVKQFDHKIGNWVSVG